MGAARPPRAAAGDWNGWDLYSAAELTFCEDGLWRGRVPQAQLGQLYKYNIQGPDGSWQLRADPFAFAFEALPGTASRLAEPNYRSPLPCCAVPAGMLPF